MTSVGALNTSGFLFFENVVMKDGVDLIGADVTTTVIDADGQGSVVETSNNAMLSGFTIRNGTGGKHWYIDHYRNGGGVKCNRKNTTIAYNIIEANYQMPDTSLYGGGVFLWESTATVRNNVIVGNQSWYGSRIYTYGGSPKIINNTFVDNRYQFSWYSQTILCVSSPGAVENNILYGKYAGEIWNLGRRRATISYNNFWDNRITSYSYYHYLWNETITYENETGDNAVFADPMFVDALSGDYHLAAESPCIDTGNPLYYDPDTTRSDIGAFYFAQVTTQEVMTTQLRSKPVHQISDHKQSWGYEEGPSKGPGPCSARGRWVAGWRVKLIREYNDVAMVRPSLTRCFSLIIDVMLFLPKSPSIDYHDHNSSDRSCSETGFFYKNLDGNFRCL